MCLLSNFCNNSNNKATSKATSFKHLQTTTKQQVLPMTEMEDQAINDSQKILVDVVAYRNEANATTERGTEVIAFICN